MVSRDYETVDVPAVGEIRARAGTSTIELAGAVKVWHDKYQTAYFHGFVRGAFAIAALDLVAALLYYFLR
jgi:hypothetical protein